MNKAIHGLILVSFSIACAFLWAMLTLIGNVSPHILPNQSAPAFTRLCLQLRPGRVILPCLAAGYGLVVWFRRAKPGDVWTGFFATGMTAIVLLMFLTIIAVLLPLISALEKLAR